MSYRNIHDELSSDDKFIELSNCAQLVFFLALSHHNITTFGCLRAPLLILPHDFKKPVDFIKKGLDELHKSGIAIFDEKNEILGFPNYLKYNKPGDWKVARAWVNVFPKFKKCKTRDFFIKKAIEWCKESTTKAMLGHLTKWDVVGNLGRQLCQNTGFIQSETDMKPGPIRSETRFRLKETETETETEKETEGGPKSSFGDNSCPEQQPALIKTNLAKVYKEELDYLIELNRELNGWDDPIRPSGDHESRIAQAINDHGLEKCQLAIHGHIWRQKDFARQKGGDPEYTEVWYAFPCKKKNNSKKTMELDEGQFFALAKIGEKRKPKPKRLRPVDRRVKHPDGEPHDADRRFYDGIWNKFHWEAEELAREKGLRGKEFEEFTFKKANEDFIADVTAEPASPAEAKKELAKAIKILGGAPKRKPLYQVRRGDNREHSSE